jgi:diguanylate cyclase (GGDEF)-like protein
MDKIIDARTLANSQKARAERLEVTLVEGQHQDIGILAFGTILVPLLFLYASYRESPGSLFILAIMLLAAGIARLATTAFYRRLAMPFTLAKLRFWRAITLTTVLAFSTILGIFAYIAITQTNDYSLHLIAITMVAGYSAGTVGRNAGLQGAYPGQLITSVIPPVIALVQRDETFYRLVSIAALIFFIALRATSKSVHDQMVLAFKSDMEKEDLLQTITEKSERFDAALSNMPQGLAMVDADCRVTVANTKLHELLGLASIEENSRIDVLFEDSARNEVLPTELVLILSRIAHESANCGGRRQSVEIVTINGETLEITFQPMARGGCVITVGDITEQKALDKLLHLAHHDPLTGLPNRTFFEKRFTAMLDAAKKSEERVAVMALDLDRFKAVNDTLGHQVGDELLKAVAKRIQGWLRAEDFVSRVGGDEFIVIHANPIGNSVEKLARRLIAAVSAPYDIEGNEIMIGLTVGIAHFSEDGADAAELMRNADAALYHAKNAGRGVCRLFENQMEGGPGTRKVI